MKYGFYSPVFWNLHPESVKGAAFPGTFPSDARDGVAAIVEVAFKRRKKKKKGYRTSKKK